MGMNSSPHLDFAGAVREASSNNLTTVVDGKIQNIDQRVDQRVDQSQVQVDGFISNARKEFPFYRITKNQLLTGTTGSVPSHWSSGGGTSFTLVQSVNTGTLWENRTAEEQALLTAIGRSGVQHFLRNFNIWKMEWSTPTPSHTMYQQVNLSTITTVAAMVKLLSGSLSGHWAQGAVLNEWKLTGSHYGRTNLAYTHCHPYRGSPTGSILFALPACVTGHVPIEDGVWGEFPYIGDTQND